MTVIHESTIDKLLNKTNENLGNVQKNQENLEKVIRERDEATDINKHAVKCRYAKKDSHVEFGRLSIETMKDGWRIENPDHFRDLINRYKANSEAALKTSGDAIEKLVHNYEELQDQISASHATGQNILDQVIKGLEESIQSSDFSHLPEILKLIQEASAAFDGLLDESHLSATIHTVHKMEGSELEGVIALGENDIPS